MTEKPEYRKGAHTVLSLKYHFVWKTKYGHPVMRGDVGLGARSILREICSEKGMTIIKGVTKTSVRSLNQVIGLIVLNTDGYGHIKHMNITKICPIIQYFAFFIEINSQNTVFLLSKTPNWGYKKVLGKYYWGNHLWSRGYFCAIVGSVTEEQIKGILKIRITVTFRQGHTRCLSPQS